MKSGRQQLRIKEKAFRISLKAFSNYFADGKRQILNFLKDMKLILDFKEMSRVLNALGQRCIFAPGGGGTPFSI